MSVDDGSGGEEDADNDIPEEIQSEPGMLNIYFC